MRRGFSTPLSNLQQSMNFIHTISMTSQLLLLQLVLDHTLVARLNCQKMVCFVSLHGLELHVLLFLPTVPTGAPQNIRVDSQNPSIISISWEPPLPEFQNGVITSYYITVIEVETGAILTFQTHGTANFYIVNSLHPFYQYNCSVAAFTIGLGPSAYDSIRTHPDGRLLYTLLVKTAHYRSVT